MSTHLPEPPVTGHPAIDDALARFDLDRPVAEHAAEFHGAHAVLQQVLNPDVGPGSPVPSS